MYSIAGLQFITEAVPYVAENNRKAGNADEFDEASSRGKGIIPDPYPTFLGPSSIDKYFASSLTLSFYADVRPPWHLRSYL